MIEITSPPIILMAILGVIGMALPVISVLRKEKGSNSFYGVIAFSALIASIGYVAYEIITRC
jgi:NADH-quinone oxidoreductase subunit N